MGFFRSKWLQRILPFLLLILLNAGPFIFVQQPSDREDELVIHAPEFFTKLSGSLQQLQIKYGLDVLYVSAIPILKKIISSDFIQGTSFDPLSAYLLTYPNRGPPCPIPIF